MPDSSEASAYPNGLSSTAVLGESPVAPQTLEHTDNTDLGEIIRQRITDAKRENASQGQRGHSWAISGRHPSLVWQNQSRWLTGTAAELACPTGRQLCRQRKVSPRTVLLVARVCAGYADARTGRNITASNATLGRVAAQLAGRKKPYSHDVISDARAILVALGLAVEVARGRYLTLKERALAAAHHDGDQIRAASTWSLITPRRWYEKIPYLPRSGASRSETPRSKCSPRLARKRAKARSARIDKTQKPPRPLAAQKVTAQLVAQAKSLDTARHLGSIVDVVAELVDCDRWSGRDLIAVLDQDSRTNPIDWPADIHHPAGFLRHRLSRISHLLAGPSPTEVAEAHHQRAIEDQQHRDAEEAAAQEHRATPAQISHHMDKIRSILKSRKARPAADTVAPGSPRNAHHH